jgi:hypothetical protein
MKLQVRFGSVSVNAETCSIGFNLDREQLDVAEADSMFSGYQLEVELSTAKASAPPLPGTEEFVDSLKATAIATRFAVSRKKYGSRLRFSLGATKFEELGNYASRDGTLIIHGVPESIELSDTDIEDVETGDETDVPEPRQRRVTSAIAVPDDAGKASIRALQREGQPFSDTLYERMELAGIATISDFEARLRRPGSVTWYDGIVGIGVSKHDELMTALVDFRSKHPIPSLDDDQSEMEGYEPAGEDDEAFRAGVQAALNGQSSESNPWVGGTLKAKEFARGYMHVDSQTSDSFTSAATQEVPE